MKKAFYLSCLLFLLPLYAGCMPNWDETSFTAIYPEDDTLTKSHIIRTGMTKEEVLSTLGARPRKSRIVSKEKEIWVYGRYWEGDVEVTLTFINDKLEKINEFYLTGNIPVF
ncbi:MAG: hypothetical protein PHH69_02185 [Candidatus Omnitrophica bacterium]|nr:hypothetical protein [Candidatus Omnitrophota bacterium]MDD5610339.1 hypothetical protein [Candidatus Omnitrophota bacterium]